MPQLQRRRPPQQRGQGLQVLPRGVQPVPGTPPSRRRATTPSPPPQRTCPSWALGYLHGQRDPRSTGAGRVM
eukprot:5933990-Heterocapsa_arctica.AAC.1